MPYIPNDDHRRDRLDYVLGAITPRSVGELNYCITRLIDNWIEAHGLSYATLNACIGVLEAAKLELYRRIAAPYEDVKCEENGDVYQSG